MDQIDEFESMFRRAEREQFVYQDVRIGRITIITDGSREQTAALKSQVQQFLPRLNADCTWNLIAGGDYRNVNDLLQRINAQPADLLITYRHLQEESLVPQHSLGVYLDVMTQVAEVPVLVLPGTAGQPISLAGRVCRRVLLVTDHISGDDRLINHGIRVCSDGGTVWLCHVEDDAVFVRYMKAISRIPEIDTQQARTLIGEQLLKEARDFIDSCVARLIDKMPHLTFESCVQQGHRLSEFRRLIETHQVDVAVANTKDEDQLAMHGMAHSLAVELQETPLLLL